MKLFFLFLIKQEKSKEEFLKKIPLKLKEISSFLGNHNFFAGDHVSYIKLHQYNTWMYYGIYYSIYYMI